MQWNGGECRGNPRISISCEHTDKRSIERVNWGLFMRHGIYGFLCEGGRKINLGEFRTSTVGTGGHLVICGNAHH